MALALLSFFSNFFTQLVFPRHDRSIHGVNDHEIAASSRSLSFSRNTFQVSKCHSAHFTTNLAGKWGKQTRDEKLVSKAGSNWSIGCCGFHLQLTPFENFVFSLVIVLWMCTFYDFLKSLFQCPFFIPELHHVRTPPKNHTFPPQILPYQQFHI